MQFNDLLRISVLLVAGVATALAAIGVIIANRDVDELALEVAGVWWVVAAIAGTWFGRPTQTAGAMSRVLAGSRMATSLPSESPGRIAFMRLWPIGCARSGSRMWSGRSILPGRTGRSGGWWRQASSPR